MFGQGPVCLLRVILLHPFGTFCCKIVHLCGSHVPHDISAILPWSLWTKLAHHPRKTVAFGVSFWQIILFLNSSFGLRRWFGSQLTSIFSGASAKTMLERLASYWTKMFTTYQETSRKFTGRRCFYKRNQETSCKLLYEDLNMILQRIRKRLASYCTKILQHIRKIVIDNADHLRTLLHPPQKTPSPQTPPKKTMLQKWQQSPPLEGRRHLKTCAFWLWEKRFQTAETKGI